MLFPSPSSAFLTTHALLVSLSLLYLLLLAFFQAGHVSAKTDAFALGVVLLELLTALPSSNRETNEFLYQGLSPVLQGGAKALPSLDARAGKWPKKKALGLMAIARSCLKMFPRARCTVSDVLVQLDVLAGREAVVRAGRGEEYDPMTGKLVQTVGR